MLLNWVLEKTLEYTLDCKETKPVDTKGKKPEYSLDRLILKLIQHFGHLSEEPTHKKRP